jgi:DNA-binding NarL/FixJ family response regulator
MNARFDNSNSAAPVSKALIADDQPLSVDGLSSLLKGIDAGIEVLEARNFGEALRLAREFPRLKLIFLAVDLPGSTAFGGLEEIVTEQPDAPIIILTSTHDDGRIVEAFGKGAKGYILRSSSREVLRLAISLVIAGETYIPSDAIAGIETSHSLGEAISRSGHSRNPVEELSPRQLQVLQHMIEGHPNKVIAHKLALRETTVKTHVKGVMKKLGVSNRTQAVLNALRFGCRPLNTGT